LSNKEDLAQWSIKDGFETNKSKSDVDTKNESNFPPKVLGLKTRSFLNTSLEDTTSEW